MIPMKGERGLIQIAREGNVIGKWFPKNIRYLKCRENLRPSDHALVGGEWCLLFRIGNGFFWRWVEQEKYEQMYSEEMIRTDNYINNLSQLAEQASGVERANHLSARTEYMALKAYLEKMLEWQKVRWKKRKSPLNQNIIKIDMRNVL